MLLTLLYLAISLLLILFTKRQWRLWILSSKLPGPSSLPLIGTTRLAKNKGDILKNVVEMRKEFPSPMKLWMSIDLNVVVDRPEDVKEVFTSNKCLNRMDFYKFLESFAGIGIVTLDTPRWQMHRKLLNPSFNNLTIQPFIPVFDAKSKTLVDTLRSESGVFDLLPFINNCVLDLICETSTGVKMNFQKNQNMGYIKALEKMFKIVMDRTSTPWLHPDFLYKISSVHREATKNIEITNSFIDDIFKCNEEKMKNSLEKSNKFFIDQLMDFHQTGIFTKKEVVSSIQTIIIAGSETTAHGSAYSILLLAMHPEIQQKLYDEIDTILPECSDLTLDNINELKFLDMVVKETLRLFPLVPFMARKVSGDFQIGSYNIPSGATIGISIYTLHRSVEVWGEDADKFNPDNFLPENVRKRHPYSFIPFASGARNCIGDKYAMLSMKILIINLLRAYKFSTHLKLEELETEMHITLKLVNKFLVSVTHRS